MMLHRVQVTVTKSLWPIFESFSRKVSAIISSKSKTYTFSEESLTQTTFEFRCGGGGRASWTTTSAQNAQEWATVSHVDKLPRLTGRWPVKSHGRLWIWIKLIITGLLVWARINNHRIQLKQTTNMLLTVSLITGKAVWLTILARNWEMDSPHETYLQNCSLI